MSVGRKVLYNGQYFRATRTPQLGGTAKIKFALGSILTIQASGAEKDIVRLVRAIMSEFRHDVRRLLEQATPEEQKRFWIELMQCEQAVQHSVEG